MVFIVLGALKAVKAMKREIEKSDERHSTITPLDSKLDRAEDQAEYNSNGSNTSFEAYEPPTNASCVSAWSRDDALAKAGQSSQSQPSTQTFSRSAQLSNTGNTSRASLSTTEDTGDRRPHSVSRGESVVISERNTRASPGVSNSSTMQALNECVPRRRDDVQARKEMESSGRHDERLRMQGNRECGMGQMSSEGGADKGGVEMKVKKKGVPMGMVDGSYESELWKSGRAKTRGNGMGNNKTKQLDLTQASKGTEGGQMKTGVSAFSVDTRKRRTGRQTKEDVYANIQERKSVNNMRNIQRGLSKVSIDGGASKTEGCISAFDVNTKKRMARRDGE